MLLIRKALPEDLFFINDIYNDAILNSTATFHTEARTLENNTDWLLDRDDNHPVIVAELKGEIVGFAALNKWSERKAYDITAEMALYIHKDHRGKGIGQKLLAQILAIAASTNLVSIIARITEGNEHSIYLHKQQGFAVMGIMKKAGLKFGKLLDVTFMQKVLK
jgi:L-amino acid N-acyltransferase YncA